MSPKNKRLPDKEFRDRMLGPKPPPNALRAYAIGVTDGEKVPLALRLRLEEAEAALRAALSDRLQSMEILATTYEADLHLGAHCDLFSNRVPLRLGGSGIVIQGKPLRAIIEAPREGR